MNTMTRTGSVGTADAPTKASRTPEPRCFVRLLPLDAGFYALKLADGQSRRETTEGFVLPAVQVCAPPNQEGRIEITDGLGRPGSWLASHRDILFIRSPAQGTALVTAYLPPTSADAPLELEIQPIAAAIGTTVASSSPVEPMRLRLDGTASPSPPAPTLEVIAHIRGRGDVRFADAPWIGRLGPGLWIEALTIVPGNRLAAEAIEYKALTASGTETPWLGCGSQCGTTGQGIPLIGLAVRQKSATGDALFDCEYTGYFGSGATAGPLHNGAPCRSAVTNDPLEGLQLRITPRSGARNTPT